MQLCIYQYHKLTVRTIWYSFMYHNTKLVLLFSDLLYWDCPAVFHLFSPIYFHCHKFINQLCFQHASRWAVSHWSWLEREWRSCGHYQGHLYSYLSQHCCCSCSLPLLHSCSTVWICWVSKLALKNMLNSKLSMVEGPSIYHIQNLFSLLIQTCYVILSKKIARSLFKMSFLMWVQHPHGCTTGDLAFMMCLRTPVWCGWLQQTHNGNAEEYEQGNGYAMQKHGISLEWLCQSDNYFMKLIWHILPAFHQCQPCPHSHRHITQSCSCVMLEMYMK